MKNEYSSYDLKKHLEEEHRQSPFSQYLKEIVYGGTDGIVTTFAIVAGFTGANVGSLIATHSYFIVLLFGFANLFADGVSMALSNFLSLRSEQDLYRVERARELHEIRNSKDLESQETKYILMKKGYSERDASAMTALYAKNEDYWADFMMHHELELPNPEGENPRLTALATLLAFIAFGFIPLIPYVAGFAIDASFGYSVMFVFLALVLLGALRWRVTKQTVIRSIGEVVFVGGVAATIAYIVGIFFRI